MMRYITPLVVLLVALTVSAAVAQNQIPERLLLTTGDNIGSGARPLGMAGTYTGIADDFSSLWWNPAGLAQVKRIEIQGSLVRTGFSNSTDYFRGTREGSTNTLRLNNAGAVFPVPVYQGALTFALGYNQVADFDRRARVRTPENGSHFWDDFDELQNGRIGLWSLGSAVDVSQNLALGMGVNYWSGAVDYTRTAHYSESDTVFYNEKTVTTDLSAWGLSVGALYRAGRYVRIGAMYHTPTVTNFDLDWTRTEDNLITYARTNEAYRFSYKMTSPAIMRVGASVAPGRWMLAADIEYRDWTSLKFRDTTPYPDTLGHDLTRAQANQEIMNTYQAAARISVGGEYLLPAYGTRLRAGYRHEQPSFRSDESRNVYALGLGFLIDRVMMLDVGYAFTKNSQSTPDGLNGIVSEDIHSNALLVTLSYRM